MTSLVLYVKGYELYRKEIEYPNPGKRLDRHGRIDWRKAHIEGEAGKIKILFYRQIAKYEWKIIMEATSKMNK